MRTPFAQDASRPFQLVKFLSWSSLILILGFSLFLVVIIGKYAEQTILEKDKDFALLLAENLNHQIYHNFTLPAKLSFGRIQLKQKVQYERLDMVIRSTIHGFNLQNLKIMEPNGKVSYAMDNKLLGRQVLGNDMLKELAQEKIKFNLIQKKTSIWSFFDFDLPEGSFILQTIYPMRYDRKQTSETIIGFMQFNQDITNDYERINYFQLLIVAAVCISSLVLFLLLYFFIKRADKLIAERIKEKERLERELMQNEKLASMGRMLASVSHEIRNPLGVIQSSAELLAKRADMSAPLSAKLSKAIFEESQRLSRTVNNFLDFARPKQPKFAPVNLTSMLREVRNFLSTELKEANVTLQLDLPDKIEISGDYDLLYRAFYNLISNAYQAVDKGGSIHVAWQEQYKLLSIHDSGPGFDQSLMDKYLEPFYTSKDTGTGLGLAIVHNILQNHGAVLELKTAGQGGGLVNIYFEQEDKKSLSGSMARQIIF